MNGWRSCTLCGNRCSILLAIAKTHVGRVGSFRKNRTALDGDRSSNSRGLG